jgi:hypothetical protein
LVTPAGEIVVVRFVASPGSRPTAPFVIARVARLAAALAVERRAVEQHRDGVALGRAVDERRRLRVEERREGGEILLRFVVLLPVADPDDPQDGGVLGLADVGDGDLVAEEFRGRDLLLLEVGERALLEDPWRSCCPRCGPGDL